MSFYEHTPQHRAGTSVATERRVYGTSITDPEAIPALKRANRRMHVRRIAFDAVIALTVAALALVLVLLITEAGVH